MELVGLSPLSSRPAANWAREQRTSLRGHTAFGVSGSDDAFAASVRHGASRANRNFPALAKQSISFAVCETKALAIDRILRNDSLAGLDQRGKSAPNRPPGVVGYCPSKHTHAHGQD